MLTLLTLLSLLAATPDGGIKIQSGAFGNTNHVTQVTITGDTNIVVPGNMSLGIGDTNTISSWTLYNTNGQTFSFTLIPSQSAASNFRWWAAPFTGLVKSTVSAVTNVDFTQAVAGTDYQTPISVAGGFVGLTDGATITGTCDATRAVQNWSVVLGGARALAISGAATGMTGVLIVKQDATGSRTLSLPSGSRVINGGSGAITLTTTANAVDVLTWVYDGTNYYWTYGKNYN